MPPLRNLWACRHLRVMMWHDLKFWLKVKKLKHQTNATDIFFLLFKHYSSLHIFIEPLDGRQGACFAPLPVWLGLPALSTTQPASLIRSNPGNELNESFLPSILPGFPARRDRNVARGNTQWYKARRGSENETRWDGSKRLKGRKTAASWSGLQQQISHRNFKRRRR